MINLTLEDQRNAWRWTQEKSNGDITHPCSILGDLFSIICQRCPTPKGLFEGKSFWYYVADRFYPDFYKHIITNNINIFKYFNAVSVEDIKNLKIILYLLNAHKNLKNPTYTESIFQILETIKEYILANTNYFEFDPYSGNFYKGYQG